tara:strand:+ start:43 stop:504 length:462 start_codon:yes stop_codon:yes gene_type:complete
MGFLAPAVPYIVGGTALLGMQQAGAIGSYQQAAFDRKAAIAEQKAEALENQLTLDLQKFDQKFKRLEASQVVNTAKSGVAVGTGTAKLIKLSNLYNAEIERDIMKYNTDIGIARAFEEASFARIEGTLAKQRATMEQIKIASSAGTSLLTMQG